MPYMTRLENDLKSFFPRVDVVPGWETRGNASFAPAVVVNHWTAGPRGTTRRASLGVCTNGREGLPGPLCNIYLDRDGIPVIVAAGRANHAGTGGYKGATGNSAAYGIEAESAGNNDWTPAQRTAYPRLVAAMLKGLERDSEWTCGHNEWAPTRKIDINDWPMSLMRQQVSDILKNGSEGEDELAGLYDKVKSPIPGDNGKEVTYADLILHAAMKSHNAHTELSGKSAGLLGFDVRSMLSRSDDFHVKGHAKLDGLKTQLATLTTKVDELKALGTKFAADVRGHLALDGPFILKLRDLLKV